MDFVSIANGKEEERMGHAGSTRCRSQQRRLDDFRKIIFRIPLRSTVTVPPADELASTTTMTVRRPSSTTSLARYARANSPDLVNRSLDFCNAFWGQADSGVDVLLARMRGAARTMDELKGFWKER